MASKKIDPEMMIQTQQTLAGLAAEALALSKELLECGGELSPALEARLNFNADNLVAKVDGYVAIEEQFKAQADIWKLRRDASDAISKRYTGFVQKLRDRVKWVMSELGTDELKGGGYRYKLQKSSAALVIDDESKIPPDFKMVIQTTVIDRDKIKSALSDGFEIPGARLEFNGTLRVYEANGS